MTEQKVFARKASGLVRGLTPTDMILYASGFAGIPLAAQTAVWMFAWQPGAEQGIGGALTAVLCAFVMLCFGFFMVAMPRAGADYLFISRSISPMLGFVSSQACMVALTFWAGWQAYFLATAGLPVVLTCVGIAARNVGLINVASSMTAAPLNMILPLVLGIPYIWGLSLVTVILPTKKMFVWIRFWWVVQVVGTVLAIAVLAIIPKASFINSYDSLTKALFPSSGGFDSVISGAKAEGFNPSPGLDWIGTFSLIPVLTAIYLWAMGPAILAGEVKEVKKSAYIGMLGGVAIAAIVSIATYYAMLAGVGQDFAASVSYLSFFDPSKLPFSTPMIYVLASIAVPNVILAFIMGLSYLAMPLWVAPLNPLYGTRSLFAQGLDNMMPEWMTRVNKWHTPKYTPIPVLGLATVWLVLFILWPVVGIMFTFISSVWPWLLVPLAAIFFPFVKKSIFEASPIKYKVAGIPVMSIVGVIGFIFVLITLAIYAVFPVYGGAGIWTWVATAVILGASAIIFYAIRAYRKSQGIDVDLAFREIPPV